MIKDKLIIAVLITQYEDIKTHQIHQYRRCLCQSNRSVSADMQYRQFGQQQLTLNCSNPF